MCLAPSKLMAAIQKTATYRGLEKGVNTVHKRPYTKSCEGKGVVVGPCVVLLLLIPLISSRRVK